MAETVRAAGRARVRPFRACATTCAAGFALGVLRFPDARLFAELCAADMLLTVAPDGVADDAPLLRAAASGDAFALAGVAPGTGLTAWLVAAPPSASLEVLPRLLLNVWLMSINCSRLFTCTSWSMYSLGSVSAVGSWFCISVTSSVKKSFAEMVAESPLASLELPLSDVPVVPDVPAAALVIGVAVTPARAWPAVNA